MEHLNDKNQEEGAILSTKLPQKKSWRSPEITKWDAKYNLNLIPGFANDGNIYANWS